MFIYHEGMFGWFVPCNQHIKYILTQLTFNILTLACISCCHVLVHSYTQLTTHKMYTHYSVNVLY